MKIIAVIVTYNRLKLLKKCLQHVKDQTRKPDNIIVINNGSTDETGEWLSEQDVLTYTQENKGGAGGFSLGINKAFAHGADWIWLMDDDTIPQADALEQLLNVLNKLQDRRESIGFLSSTVLWTDGDIHEMNRVYALHDEAKKAKLAFPEEVEYPFVQFGTFVSMLLSAKAVKKVGLPIKEYFIWNDDVEYSKRVIAAGMAGLAVKDSIIVHETPSNHESNVFTDPPASLWKFRYGLRNELFTKRMHEGEIKFWISWTHRMFIMPFRIALRRKTHKWAFIKTVWQTSMNAVFFRPSVQMADEKEQTHARQYEKVEG